MLRGTPNAGQPTAAAMGSAFLRAIGSRMFFTSNTIDQPGKQISMALHGKWLGGEPDFEQADAWMLLGNNPIISKSAGIPGQNPAQKLKDAQGRGLQLIVVDPRVSDVARKAAIHLQCRPGEDHAILAGLINIIISENLYDRDFVRDNVSRIRQHVRRCEGLYARSTLPTVQVCQRTSCWMLPVFLQRPGCVMQIAARAPASRCIAT